MKLRHFLVVFAAPVLLGMPLSNASGVSDTERYQHHILAVDENGSAVVPIVSRSGPAGARRYKVRHEAMNGEDTGNLETALGRRQPLHDYLTAMFEEMARSRPREVVIYIHGGLNNINGAIEKSARLTDYFAEQEPESRTYFIGICWNSSLYRTYTDHLWKVREGLRQPGRAMVSAPAAILADVGSAVARAPLRMIDLLYNDLHTMNPNGFARNRAAEARYALLSQPESGTHAFRGEDERSAVGKGGDALRWVATSPIKAAAVPIIDTLGVQPWKNMVRRTRTMFERETSMLPVLTPSQLSAEAGREGLSPRQLHDKLTATARYGATRIFCQYGSRYLALVKQNAGARRPVITLVGHSMGAIVAGEMLHRSHSHSAFQLPFDNIVLMAAACSVNDFKNKMVPYLASDNAAKSKRPGEKNTRFFNLCLHDNAERAEKNPGEWDLSPRGSLLVWIDTMYQEPESENDRTLGRWENAVLATDDIPGNVLERTTIKAFGRNRVAEKPPVYTIKRGTGKQVREPKKHGEFARFKEKEPEFSFAFWRPIYWEIE